MWIRLALRLFLSVTPFTPLLAQQKVVREDVSFMSDTVRLAGTVFRAENGGRSPAVVLIHGSGATDRSTMRYYAELFAIRGITALAYDKRGVGKSQGAPNASRYFSLADLAADAAAGVRYLRSRPDVDSAGVGIFGVSQGGWVAPLAAQMIGNVGFVVAVSASLTTIAEDNLFERSARLKREGFSAADVESARTMHVLDLATTRPGGRFAAFDSAWTVNQSSPWFKRVYLDPRPAGAESPYRTWYRSVMDVDPMPVWRSLTVPVLFVFGDPALDLLSPVAQSTALVERLRAEGRDVHIINLPGADHSLKRGGNDVEIGDPLAAWIRPRVSH